MMSGHVRSRQVTGVSTEPSFLVCSQVVQDELGKPWYEVYAELTPEPIAAASLGQVGVGGDGAEV